MDETLSLLAASFVRKTRTMYVLLRLMHAKCVRSDHDRLEGCAADCTMKTGKYLSLVSTGRRYGSIPPTVAALQTTKTATKTATMSDCGGSVGFIFSRSARAGRGMTPAVCAP